MNRVWAVGSTHLRMNMVAIPLAAGLAISACTSSCVTQERVREANDFFEHVNIPYIAPAARRVKIERARTELQVGMTERDLLILAGKPDYTASVNLRSTDGSWSSPFEVWHYVLELPRTLSPWDGAKILMVTLSSSPGQKAIQAIRLAHRSP